MAENAGSDLAQENGVCILMGAFGPRTYLVGQVLPVVLRDMPTPVGYTQSEKLDEVIRITLYIVDLMIARMGQQIKHDWEEQNG